MKRPRVAPDGKCHVCRREIPSEFHRLRQVCAECSPRYEVLKNRAQMKARAAVSRGELPPASSLSCEDCGDTAKVYDHRDYSKPLQVAAVCHSCNIRRGPGLAVFA